MTRTTQTRMNVHELEEMQVLKKTLRQSTADSLPSSNGSLHDSVVSCRQLRSKPIPCNYSQSEESFPVYSEVGEQGSEESCRRRPAPLPIPEATVMAQSTDPDDQLEAISSLLHELQGLRRLRVVLKRELVGLGHNTLSHEPNTKTHSTAKTLTKMHVLRTPNRSKADARLKDTKPQSVTNLENEDACCQVKEVGRDPEKDSASLYNVHGSREVRRRHANRGSYLALLKKRQKLAKRQARRVAQTTMHPSWSFKIGPSQIPKPVGRVGLGVREQRPMDSRIPKPLVLQKLECEVGNFDSLDKAIGSINAQLERLNLRQNEKEAQKQHLKITSLSTNHHPAFGSTEARRRQSSCQLRSTSSYPRRSSRSSEVHKLPPIFA